MKVIKGIGICFASVVFLFGIVLYSIHDGLKHIVNEQAVDAVVDNLVDTTIRYSAKSLYQYLPPEVQEQMPPAQEIVKLLPQEAQDELEKVKEAFAKDEQVHALLQKYSEAIIAGLDDANAQLPDVNKDIEAIVKDKLPMVASAVGVDFTEAEVANFAQEISKEVDLQPLVEQGITTIREETTPQQKQVIAFVGFSQSQECFVFALSFMGFALGLIAILKKSFYRWMPYIAVLCVLGGGFIFAGITLAKLLLTQDIAAIADGVFASFLHTSAVFFCVGILMFVVYMVIKMILKHKEQKIEGA